MITDALKNVFAAYKSGGVTSIFTTNPSKTKASTVRQDIQDLKIVQASATFVIMNETLADPVYIPPLGISSGFMIELDPITSYNDLLAMLANFEPLLGETSQVSTALERFEQHTDHMTAVLPTVINKASTVSALRSATDEGDECSAEDHITSDITEQPTTNSTAQAEVLGSLSSSGEQKISTAEQYMNEFDTAVPITLSSPLLVAFNKIYYKARKEYHATLNPDSSTTVWVNDIINTLFELAGLITPEMLTASSTVNAQTAVINDSVTAERVNVGLPDTDGGALTNPVTGTTIPMGDAAIPQAGAGDLDKEIKQRSELLEIKKVCGDACNAAIIARMGSDDMKKTTVDVAVDSPLNPLIDIAVDGENEYKGGVTEAGIPTPDVPAPIPPAPPPIPVEELKWTNSITKLWCGVQAPAAGQTFSIQITFPDMPNQRPSITPGTYIFTYTSVLADVPPWGRFDDTNNSTFYLGIKKKALYGATIMRKLIELVHADTNVAAGCIVRFVDKTDTHSGQIIPYRDTILSVAVTPLYNGAVLHTGIIKPSEITIEKAFEVNEEFRKKYENIL